MSLTRVLQNTPVTVEQQWTEDGAVVDPGTVTVGIVRGDGTELVAAGTGTGGTGTGPRTYNLTTTHTSLLDRLTFTWTSPTKGILTSYAEIVGGFLFTLAEAREDTTLASLTNYPTARVERARSRAEVALERACRVAFVPRWTSEVRSGDGGLFLNVRWPQVRTVRAALSGTTSLTAADIDPSPAGLYRAAGWDAGVQNITVRYEHGYDEPPGEISRAAVRLAKHYLLASPTDDRAVRMDTEEGSYALAVPGRGGSRFGIPDVDAVVRTYAHVLSVA